MARSFHIEPWWLAVGAVMACSGNSVRPDAEAASGSGGIGGAAGGIASGIGGAAGGIANGIGGAAGGIASGIGGAAGGIGAGGARPRLTAEEASVLTIRKYLESGGNLDGGLLPEPWDPTQGAGEVSTFIANYTVAATGGTHTTVQAAISAAVSAGGADRVFIRVEPGTYREALCVASNAPPITLYAPASDASEVVIVNDNYNAKAKLAAEPANPCSPNTGQLTYGTAGSATAAVFAKDFHAKNLTFANDLDEAGLVGGLQAVALLTQGDRLIFDNVRVLGNQDTLYLKSGSVALVARVYLKDCYVEGDVDFVFGRGTAVFDNCTLHSLSARRGTSGGYVLAPSTDQRNAYGLLVINSRFTAEAGTPAESVYLGRAWDESQTDLATYAANVSAAAARMGTYPNGQALVRETSLGEHIRRSTPWGPAATTSRPFNAGSGAYPANRLYEYANTGPGAP